MGCAGRGYKIWDYEGPMPGIANIKKRLYLIAFALLLSGLTSAVGIYEVANKATDDAWSVQYENSKMHRHDVQLIGGDISLLADRLSNWFDGLWQGKQLAYTIACISCAASGALFLVAHHLPPEPDSDARDGGESWE